MGTSRASDADEDRVWHDTIIVHEPEESATTGILDQHGKPILRTRSPIGFIELKEHNV